MKRLYSNLIAILALGLFAPLATGGTFPSWELQFTGPTRFQVLTQFSGAAVLDRETGLVWEQSPSTSSFFWGNTARRDAQDHCNDLTVGNRKGWRLPTIQELASLVDPSVRLPGPSLPTGHPFKNVSSSVYWSATTSAVNNNDAWIVDLSTGTVAVDPKTDSFFVWCVRGGQGVDAQ